jgi:SM-20-related protein
LWGFTLFEDAILDGIADTLAEQGYIILKDFLPEALANALRDDVVSMTAQAFKPASVGRQQSQRLNTQIRSDKIHWLGEAQPPQKAYLQMMEQLRVALNQRLFMGLFDYESHYAHYGPGDCYHRHVDAFKGASNRVLSTVFYLNRDWAKDEAGELLMYADEQSSPFMIITPKFNTCVLFLSEQFPHEVRAAKRDRYSIAGWFRLNSSSNQRIDPRR